MLPAYVAVYTDVKRPRGDGATLSRDVKLIIQIPCKDEEAQLPGTLADLPREVPGFDVVEWLVIDDGSTDRTIEVARANGVDHIVKLTNNKGLAAGFQAGLDACLKLGADVIVNTDADNQYYGGDIHKLVEPIIARSADMVVGDRETDTIEHFSPLKKRLQRLGSAVVRRASGTNVPDTTSGFRAYNREAALQMVVVSRFTYTLETIIQAGKTLVAVDHVPIRTNPKTRESRLFPSMWSYVRRNSVAIFRVYALYEPLRVFMIAAGVVALPAAVIWARFIYFFLIGEGEGHVQSLILGSTLLIISSIFVALGVIGDLLAASRSMQQRTLERVRRVELSLGVEPSHYEPAEAPDTGTTGADSGTATGKRRGGAPVSSGVATPGSTDPGTAPTGNTFDKYGSTNPVVRRLMARFHGTLDELWHQAAPSSVLDVGCGEGVLTHEWAERLGDKRIVGIDLDDPELQAEWATRQRPNLEYRIEEATALPFADGEFELATAIEVLEHVPEPEATVAEMARVASRHLLVSVPREPMWRGLNMARGAYLKDLGNTPGHVNHWSKRSFVKLLAQAR